MMVSLREIFLNLETKPYSKFDPPKADKCLLASGELDVRCLQSAGGGFEVHWFLSRFDWTLAARGSADTWNL